MIWLLTPHYSRDHGVYGANLEQRMRRWVHRNRVRLASRAEVKVGAGEVHALGNGGKNTVNTISMSPHAM